jgi:hypothetical protein
VKHDIFVCIFLRKINVSFTYNIEFVFNLKKVEDNHENSDHIWLPFSRSVVEILLRSSAGNYPTPQIIPYPAKYLACTSLRSIIQNEAQVYELLDLY